LGFDALPSAGAVSFLVLVSELPLPASSLFLAGALL
jgi:hypothetical protein